jgi:hypothetical protein
MEEVHALSVDLLEFLGESDDNVGVGILALLLTVGRLMNDKTMEAEEELEFIQGAMEFCGMYFSGANIH